MRKSFLLLLLIVSALIFATSLIKISPIFSPSGVTLSFEFDSDVSEKNVYLEKNASGSLISIYLQGIKPVLDSFFLPIAYGPVESLRIINTRQGSLAMVQLLVPKQPEMTLSRRTLKLFFPSSEKRLSIALTGGDLETAIKYLAEELKLNVVLSEAVKNYQVSLKLDNILPEDVLRNILVIVRVNNEPLAYSYMPDGTLHIGTRSDIATRFEKFWGVFEVKDEKIVQKLESLLSPNVVMSYLANKSVLFVYGDVQEQEIIAKILSLTPQIETREFISVGFIEETKKLLEALKGLYSFEYHLLDGLDKFILKSDPQTLDRVFHYLGELERSIKLKQVQQQRIEGTEQQAVQRTVTDVVRIIYPKEAIEILKKLNIGVEEISFGQLQLTAEPEKIELAKKILEDLGFFDVQQIRKITVPKAYSEKILEALTQIIGLPVSRILAYEDKAVVNIALLAPASVQSTAEELIQRLIHIFTTTKLSEIFFLKDKDTSKQIATILNQVYDVEASSIENVLKITGTPQDVEKARRFIDTFVKQRHTKVLNLTVEQDLFIELKTLVELTFDVKLEANLRSLGLIIMSSEDKEQLELAAKEIENITKLLLKKPSETYELVPVVEGVDFNDLRLLMTEIYKVKIEKTQFFYLLVGQKESIDGAKQLLENIRRLVGKPIETTYKLVKVRNDLDINALTKAVGSVTKVELINIDNLLLVKGEETQISKAIELIKIIEENVPIKVEENKKQTVIVKQHIPNFPTEEFKTYLGKIGLDVDLEAFSTLGVVVISGQEEKVIKAGEEFERFSQMVLKKIQIQREEEQKRQEKPLKVRKISESAVAVECDNIPLKDIVEAVAKELDVSLIFISSPQETITMKVSSIDWQQFKNVIEKNYGYSFIETENVTVFLKSSPTVDKTVEQKFIYKVSHNLDKIKSVVEFYGGKVYLDDLNDLLIITGIPRQVKEEVEKLIGELSKPLKQVEIEAKFIDRGLVDELTREGNIKLNMTPMSLEMGSSGGLNLSMGVIDLLDYRTILSLLGGATATVSLTAQTSNNLTDLLASPRIVTLSGKEARILIGEHVPYVAGIDENGRPIPAFMDVGIQLRITPTVRTDDTIHLRLFTEVSEVKERKLLGLDTYGKVSREAQTEVILKNGQTLVIGGLVQDKIVKNISKVPILGDLPFIGQLFRSVTDKKSKTELLIFITARVVEP